MNEVAGPPSIAFNVVGSNCLTHCTLFLASVFPNVATRRAHHALGACRCMQSLVKTRSSRGGCNSLPKSSLLKSDARPLPTTGMRRFLSFAFCHPSSMPSICYLLQCAKGMTREGEGVNCAMNCVQICCAGHRRCSCVRQWRVVVDSCGASPLHWRVV